MNVRDFKYLAAYILPICTVAALSLGSYWSFLTLIVAFGIIPLLEWILGTNHKNLSHEESQAASHRIIFDVLLYLNIVWVYGILMYFLYLLNKGTYTVIELTGFILSVGVMLGSNGINVAHELGHKPGKWPQTAARILLLPSLYMHFFIEHNLGHHKNVGTPKDPATSRYGENIYKFWWRSVVHSWISAWNIENKRLRKTYTTGWHHENRMIWYTMYQSAYIIAIGLVFGITTAIILALAAVVSILLLESINYIEHYGLLRKTGVNGKYEPVQTFHSWNSDHVLGRIILYELTRHSDHHFKASKKYQVLDFADDSPQLPFGYPASMLIALLPPLWFSVMNPRVASWAARHAA
jgi:alkane 1-monooxygenase